MDLSPLQYALGIGSGAVVGFSLALVGGGGSILAVPAPVVENVRELVSRVTGCRDDLRVVAVHEHGARARRLPRGLSAVAT
mgnify:CR=1 FL=1